MFLPNTFRFSPPTHTTNMNKFTQHFSTNFEGISSLTWKILNMRCDWGFMSASVCLWMSWKILIANPLKPDEGRWEAEEKKKNYFYEKIGQV